jgi:methylenetetrahydrofolate dehydrogenase (NAD+)
MIYYPFFKSAVSTTHGEGVQGDRQDLLDTTGEMQVGGVRQAVAEHARGAAGARAVDVEEEDWGRSALHIKTLSDHVRHHKTLSLSDDVLRNAVPVRKDVEALSCWYQDALYHNIRTLSMLPADERPPPAPGSKCLVPCAPLAVVKILEHLAIYDPQLPTGQGLAGKTVAILNRSRVVGQPLGAMLANDGAVVFSMDEDSVFRHSRSASDLDRSVTPQGAVAGADVVILGVSSPSFRMPCEWVAPGTLVINVAAQPNVDEHALLQVPGVTYVPKIGQMTVAMLQRNLVRLIENFHLPPGLT